MNNSETRMMLFSGNANRPLAEKLAKNLKLRLGKALVSCFSDGEVQVEIEENVRGRDIFIIQPLCKPANDHLMELLIMVDALYRASAGRITVVIPYFCYSRQDRRSRLMRVPISAKVIADMIGTVAASRVLTMDLHTDQIQGFFRMQMDNIYASPVLLSDIWQKNYDDLIIVSPDVGGVVRARALAKRLDDAGLAIIDKRRPQANESQVMNIIGDTKGKTCVIIDDLVDTAGTLCKAAVALKEHGAKSVFAYATHPVLSGNAIENITNSQIEEVVVTDTIPLSAEAQKCSKIRQISIADLLAETMYRIYFEESISSLFVD